MAVTGKRGEEIQIVAFRLGNEEYGVDIASVQEIIRYTNITRVPRADSFIEGVINLRGNVIPVFNLHKPFGIEGLKDEEEIRIIILQFADVKAGVMVDGVYEVLRIKPEQIEDTASAYTLGKADFIIGVAKVEDRLLILLDVAALLGV